MIAARALLGCVDPTKPDLVTGSLIANPKRITINNPVGRAVKLQGSRVQRDEDQRGHENTCPFHGLTYNVPALRSHQYLTQQEVAEA